MSEYMEDGVEISYEEWIAPYLARGWKHVPCFGCQGFGVVSVYSHNDFEGAGECETCHGGGMIWKTPNGHYALYPGGPFCG